ncbi:hypothetical protein D9M68_890930 [compost metagenome]
MRKIGPPHFAAQYLHIALLGRIGLQEGLLKAARVGTLAPRTALDGQNYFHHGLLSNLGVKTQEPN